MRWLGVVVMLLASLVMPARAEARLCDVLPIACSYEGAPFTIKVVDAETRQPLAGVHALAEWQQYGLHGSGGPMMAQDALSGVDGVVKFPSWGPEWGPRTGLVNANDPVVTLFKKGYRAGILYNAVGDIPVEPTAKMRRFGQDGATFGLEPFRGTPEEWVAELRKVAFPQARPASDEKILRFREAYRSRILLIWSERDKLPERFRERGQLFWSLEPLHDTLEEGSK